MGIEKFYRLTCEDCSTKGEYSDKDDALAWGWAIAYGGKKCYCPKCAPKHRNTGRGGFKKETGKQLIIGEI